MQKISVRSWTPLPVLIAILVALSGCSSSSGGSNSPDSSSVQSYMVGGSVNGLASGEGLDLLDNKGDVLTVSDNGAFSFPTALADGSTYAVTVSSEPMGQTCHVMGGSGKIRSANVTSVVVTCAFGAQ